MKRYLPLAKPHQLVLLLFVTIALVPIAGCAKMPRTVSSETKSAAEENSQDSSWKININTASASELEKLPGIGEVIARRIASHREKHGPFRRIEHLMMVRGISEKKFREIRSLVTVD